jgi:hypothetical protein
LGAATLRQHCALMHCGSGLSIWCRENAPFLPS